MILADTCLLIEYFRKTEKRNAKLMALFNRNYKFCTAAITHYEIFTGALPIQLDFWENFLAKTEILPLDKKAAQKAVEINRNLKSQRKQIGLADLFIAATAIANDLPFSTLNTKHFDRVEGLIIVD